MWQCYNIGSLPGLKHNSYSRSIGILCILWTKTERKLLFKPLCNTYTKDYKYCKPYIIDRRRKWLKLYSSFRLIPFMQAVQYHVDIKLSSGLLVVRMCEVVNMFQHWKVSTGWQVFCDCHVTLPLSSDSMMRITQRGPRHQPVEMMTPFGWVA